MVENKSGEEALLKEVMRFQETLTSYAYGLLRDWSLAQDAFQEALVAIHRNSDTFKPGSNAFAWARQIVRNKAVDIIRSRVREKTFIDNELLSLVDTAFEENFTGHSFAELDSRKRALQKCMEALSPAYLGLLLGFYRDRCSCEKLADMNLKSTDNIRQLLSRIRKSLRTCAKQHMDISGETA